MLVDLFRQGQYQAVIDAEITQAIEPQVAPIDAMVIAASHLELGHLEVALQRCRALEPVLGNRADFRRLYASSLRRTGNLREAEEIYKIALKENPADIETQNNYANLLIDLNRLDTAETILRRIISAVPSYQEAQLNLERLSNKRSSDRASITTELASAESAIKPDSGLNSLLDPLAIAFGVGEVQEDQKHRRDKKKRQNTKPLPPLPALEKKEELEELIAVARQALAEGCPKGAIYFASEVLKSDIRLYDSDAYHVIGDSYIRLGKYEAAELSLLTGRELQGDTMSGLINLTSLACARQDLVLARMRYARCLEHGIPAKSQEDLLKQIEKLELADKKIEISPASLFPVTRDASEG